MMLAPLDKCSLLLVTTHSLALAINRSQVKDPWHLLQAGSPQDGQQEVNEDGYQFGDLQESQSIDKLLRRIFGNQIGKSGKPRIENQVFFLIRLYWLSHLDLSTVGKTSRHHLGFFLGLLCYFLPSIRAKPKIGIHTYLIFVLSAWDGLEGESTPKNE